MQSPNMHMMSMMAANRDEIAGQKFGRRTIMRVLSFARPYRTAITVFVVVIVLQALLGPLSSS
jgi:hypothetical protein